MGSPTTPSEWVRALRMMQLELQHALRLARPQSSRSALVGVQGGDAQYGIDVETEPLLLAACERWARDAPLVLVAEGLADGEAGCRVFPDGADPDTARYRVIVDPIDGTRALMYGKRSAWSLAAVAPNRGPGTSLRDVFCAVMTELPTTRSRYADQLWAVRGGGAHGVTLDVTSEPPREAGPALLEPSQDADLRHSFAGFVKFYPGGKELTARLEEALFAELAPAGEGGTPVVFDDQYPSSGGQLREILAGRDRFIADLRPLILPRCSPRLPLLCAHPYDLCTVLIAEEAGAIVTDALGAPLNSPLNVADNVAWVGYANPALRRLIEPRLQRLLRAEGLLHDGEGQ